MADRFDAALAFVLAREGGYSDHPLDPGGPTNRGITLKTLAAARGVPVTAADVKALTLAETGEIYRVRYWDVVRAASLPPGVDLVVFDAAVLSGPRRAALFLQNSLGVEQDGVIGRETLMAARRISAPALIRALCAARLGAMRRLPGWLPFGRGWRRRIDALERAALAMAGASPAPAASPASTSTPKAKEPAMKDVKSILASRTVWANLVGLSAFGLSILGFDTTILASPGFSDALLQVVTAGGFVASTVFRVLATRRIGG